VDTDTFVHPFNLAAYLSRLPTRRGVYMGMECVKARCYELHGVTFMMGERVCEPQVCGCVRMRGCVAHVGVVMDPPVRQPPLCSPGARCACARVCDGAIALQAACIS
jgi:hypothetical protein